MDLIDKKILGLLQVDSRLTFKEIASKINLTATPVFERIKKMEQQGIIKKYVALLDRKKMGASLMVYCQVTLIKQTKESSQAFEQAVENLTEVLECSFVSGSFDYLLKVVVKNMDQYHEFHQTKLSSIEGVSLINSFFIMAQSKFETSIPIYT